MRIILPAQNVKVDAPDGVDPDWYGKLKAMEAVVNLFSEVNFATMTTGQHLVWDATQKKFVAGA